VADAIDAMTHDSPCRKGLPADKAFAEVALCQGEQFDPQCATAFLAIRRRVEQDVQSETTPIGTAKHAPRPTL
jgi:HD-GYP domain-containing protein (c-di-GMP phosphodiesterase class II)